MSCAICSYLASMAGGYPDGPVRYGAIVSLGWDGMVGR